MTVKDRLIALAIIIPLLCFMPFAVYESTLIVRDADAGFGHAELAVK